ncbi:hypothetical protein TIFTF001_034330 [Ficus carica]|uniref:Uncharacterized protein n=1 Tax=Ficus carica TaxID=3494 RepID=A0AA88E7R4_FICCA|nr:hypothetical protein TIFTF001_034330 [Ficus carica]
MMASKLPRVVPTRSQVGFGPWFELDWAGHPNHSMAACHSTNTYVMLSKQPIGNT